VVVDVDFHRAILPGARVSPTTGTQSGEGAGSWDDLERFGVNRCDGERGGVRLEQWKTFHRERRGEGVHPQFDVGAAVEIWSVCAIDLTPTT
jgi:hypothetical protein